jgi:hypothetical protein
MKRHMGALLCTVVLLAVSPPDLIAQRKSAFPTDRSDGSSSVNPAPAVGVPTSKAKPQADRLDAKVYIEEQLSKMEILTS